MKTLRPVEYYSKLPVSPTVDVCLVLDPMLATGGSAVAVVDILKKWGARRIKFVGIIAAPEGVERLTTAHPEVPIYVAAIDDHLNESGLIVPGLGDAGDRQHVARSVQLRRVPGHRQERWRLRRQPLLNDR